jgi:hemerythrin-like domain-containing protein
MFHEAKEEHRAVDALVLPDLKATDPSTLEFSGRAKVCKELLEHHIEEEESEMFPEAREMFDEARLEAMGQQMAELKARLQKELAAGKAA